MARKGIEFGTGQIGELIAIDAARIRRGETGIGPEVHELITRLTSGGVGTSKPRKSGDAATRPSPDPRLLIQAKVLWDKGWARVMAETGIATYDRFEDYAASLPPVPEFLAAWDARFPHLVLVDKRPFLRPEQPLALTEACKLLGVQFGGDDATFVSYDPRTVPVAPVYWMHCQDGRAYRNRKPSDCRTEFAARGDEVGLAAFEGLSLYAQHREVFEVGTAMDLVASVRAGSRDDCAYLRRWDDGEVKLRWSWGDDARPDYGSASRGSATFNPRA